MNRNAPPSTVYWPSRRAEKMKTRQHGMSIIELLVAIAIGMMTVLAIMQVMAQAEQWRRNAAVGADAQTSGHIGNLILGRELVEAGGGLAAMMTPCSPNASAGTYGGIAWARYDGKDVSFPIPSLPVVITTNPYKEGGDRIEILRAVGRMGAWPAIPVTKPGSATAPIPISSPEGFVEGGLILLGNNTFNVAGTDYGCAIGQVSAIKSGGTVAGAFDLEHKDGATCRDPMDAAAALATCHYNDAAGLPTLIPKTGAVYSLGVLQTHRFEVQQPGKASQRLMYGTTSFLSGVEPTMTEMVDGVIYMKAYYGFDTSATPDGQVDLWAAADSCAVTATEWKCTGVTATGAAPVAARLLAVRVGMVTRSAQHDRTYGEGSYKGGTAPDKVTLWNWNCPSGVTCPKADPVYDIPSDQRDYRHRVYQTTVALRNPTWNQNLP